MVENRATQIPTTSQGRPRQGCPTSDRIRGVRTSARPPPRCALFTPPLLDAEVARHVDKLLPADDVVGEADDDGGAVEDERVLLRQRHRLDQALQAHHHLGGAGGGGGGGDQRWFRGMP